MTEQQMSEFQHAIASAKGGLEVINTLREEFSEWRDEANNEGEKEALENVLGHIEELGREYDRRLQEAEAESGTFKFDADYYGYRARTERDQLCRIDS